MIKEAIVKIVSKGDLTYDEAYTVMNEIMSGQTTPTQNAAFLAALSTKSARAETTDEIAGCAAAMRAHATKVETGMELFEISAAAHMGTRELMKKAAEELQHLPPVAVYEPTYVERPPEVDTSGEVSIEKFDDTWVVEGPWLQRLISNVNFSDYESRNWFDKNLRQSGLFDRLEAMGIQDGDIVSMYDLEFEYQR